MSLFTVTPNGVITVDTVDIQTEFQEAYKRALGADLNLDAGTPQGQLILNDTAMYTAMQQEVVNIANNYSVFFATGHALDVAGMRYGYYRKQGVATVVIAQITGSAGTTIASGAVAASGDNKFKLLDTVTIPTGGTVNAQFQAMETGPIACPAGTLTEIITTTPGWDTVNNAAPGIIGYETESDNAFRERITANMLQKRARSALGAIVDNIAALPQVRSVIGRENVRNVQATVDGVSMLPHSIYLAILGGNDMDIAHVIAEQKTTGAATNGNTTVSYRDPDLNFVYQYQIERPTAVTINVQVNYSSNAYTGADVENRITGLIQDYIAQNPFMIGQTVSGAQIARALSTFGEIDLLDVTVQASGATAWSPFVQTSISQVGVLGNIMFVKG